MRDCFDFWLTDTLFVTDSLIQDQPDEPTVSMGNGPDGLFVPETHYRVAIHNLKDASFGLHGGVGRLIEMRRMLRLPFGERRL